MAKLHTTELYKRMAITAMQILGLYGQLDKEEALAPLQGWIEQLCLVSYGGTIAAGTSEIQRNIIALRGLGLPRS
jgi:alkylation response protein AidB-like acyl-CoA dehydrogenase